MVEYISWPETVEDIPLGSFQFVNGWEFAKPEIRAPATSRGDATLAVSTGLVKTSRVQ
jgi:hypothetical protein